MSLKAFHLVFIALSVALAAFSAAWAVGQYRLEQEPQYAVAGLASAITGGVLAVYGTRFQKKVRRL
jgi:F0F1-type ATP synthase membrane subunit c/vacuolar-type H+-ATPase subunit K